MNGSRDNKRGASLIYVVILVAVLGILGTAYVAVLTFGSRSASGQRELVQAQILTESYQESITNAGIQNTDPVKAAVESYNAACDAWEASYSAYLSSLGTDDPLPEPDAFSWSYGTSSADSQKIPIEPRSSPAESAAPAAQTGSTAKTAAVTSTLGVSGSASGGAGSVGPYTISVSLVTKVTYSDNSYTQTAAYTGTGGRSGSMTGTVTKAEGTYHPGDTVEGPEISVPSSALQVSLEKNNSKNYYDTDRYNWYYNGDIGFNTKYASSDIVVYVSSAVKILNLSGFYDGGGGKHAIYLVFGGNTMVKINGEVGGTDTKLYLVGNGAWGLYMYNGSVLNANVNTNYIGLSSGASWFSATINGSAKTAKWGVTAAAGSAATLYVNGSGSSGVDINNTIGAVETSWRLDQYAGN